MSHERGIYERDIAPAGHRIFDIVNGRGEVGLIQVPEQWVTRGFMRRLLHELDIQDKAKLHIVKPGA